jgi:hypothetical protein
MPFAAEVLCYAMAFAFVVGTISIAIAEAKKT